MDRSVLDADARKTRVFRSFHQAGGLGRPAFVKKLLSPYLNVDVTNRMSEWPAEEIANGEPGDKLAGWPAWVQGVEYPSCALCGSRMLQLFQVDSEDNIPFMFGDVGCGNITQCPEHKEIVAFGWACT